MVRRVGVCKIDSVHLQELEKLVIARNEHAASGQGGGSAAQSAQGSADDIIRTEVRVTRAMTKLERRVRKVLRFTITCARDCLVVPPVSLHFDVLKCPRVFPFPLVILRFSMRYRAIVSVCCVVS